MRIPGDRTRGTSYFVMLIVGAGMFAMFYFLGIYIQTILGYSPLKTGLAFLPFSVGIVVAAQVASLPHLARSTRAGSPAPAPASRRSACGASPT